MIELRGGDRALFASDVHLDERDPLTADAFFDSLAREAPGASYLFLLGDLFEAWVGDDDPSPLGERLARALEGLAEAGMHVFLMRGNRDFLLDVPVPGAAAGATAEDGRPSVRPFSARAGATMLDDPCPVLLFGTPALLSHGDALCTDDADYQAFRAQSRDPAWQRAFLSRPLGERLAVARALRERSEVEKSAKADYLMDVNPTAVQRTMREAGVALLIHGHTHRPACHRIQLDHASAARWVLPDWDGRAGRGGMLEASAAQGLRRVGRWD